MAIKLSHDSHMCLQNGPGFISINKSKLLYLDLVKVEFYTMDMVYSIWGGDDNIFTWLKFVWEETPE